MKLPIIYLARQSDQIALLRRLYEIGCTYFGLLNVEDAVCSWGAESGKDNVTQYPWMYVRNACKRMTAISEDGLQNDIDHFNKHWIKVNSLDHFISCARRAAAQPKDLDI